MKCPDCKDGTYLGLGQGRGALGFCSGSCAKAGAYTVDEVRAAQAQSIPLDPNAPAMRKIKAQDQLIKALYQYAVRYCNHATTCTRVTESGRCSCGASTYLAEIQALLKQANEA